MLRSSVGGRGVWRRMDTCMCMAESFYCSPEAVTTLLISYALRVQPCSTLCDPTDPQTVACQVPLSMGFSRQEYWNGLPCPPPGDLPDPGIQPTSSAATALAGTSFITEPPGLLIHCCESVIPQNKTKILEKREEFSSDKMPLAYKRVRCYNPLGMLICIHICTYIYL